MFNHCESTDLLRLSDIQSGDALTDARSFLFFSISPSIYTSQHTIQCLLFTCPSPFFSSLLSFPHSYAAHCLSSPPHNGFCDVQRRIFWSVLIAFNGREQGEGRKKGLETCRAQSIILIKRASVMLGCMRHTRARV